MLTTTSTLLWLIDWLIHSTHLSSDELHLITSSHLNCLHHHRIQLLYFLLLLPLLLLWTRNYAVNTHRSKNMPLTQIFVNAHSTIDCARRKIKKILFILLLSLSPSLSLQEVKVDYSYMFTCLLRVMWRWIIFRMQIISLHYILLGYLTCFRHPIEQPVFLPFSLPLLSYILPLYTGFDGKITSTPNPILPLSLSLHMKMRHFPIITSHLMRDINTY